MLMVLWYDLAGLLLYDDGCLVVFCCMMMVALCNVLADLLLYAASCMHLLPTRRTAKP